MGLLVVSQLLLTDMGRSSHSGWVHLSAQRARRVRAMARAWMPELRQRRSGCPMPGKRQARCRFLWLLLFWTSKREVTRAPKVHESPLLAMRT